MDPRDQAEENPEGGAKAFAWKFLAAIVRLSLFLFALLALLGIGLRVHARWGVSPADRARVQRELAEKLDLPPEWMNPPPWSTEVLAASNDVAQVDDDQAKLVANRSWFEAWAKSDQWIGKPLGADELDEAARYLEGVGPFFDALERAVAAPDYELVALKDRRDGVDLPSFDGDRVAAFNRAAPLASLGAAVASNRGDDAEALRLGLLLLRMGKRHEVASSYTNLRALWLARAGCECLSLVAANANDAGALERAAEALDALAPIVELRSIERMGDTGNTLGSLREYRRRGYPPDLPLNESLAYYRILNLFIENEYAAWRLPQLKPSDPEAAALDPYGAVRRGSVGRHGEGESLHSRPVRIRANA